MYPETINTKQPGIQHFIKEFVEWYLYPADIVYFMSTQM